MRAARRTLGSGAPVSADPEPGGRLHCGRAFAAPRLQLVLAGGVAVTSSGLGDGTFASVHQDLGFDVLSLGRLISRVHRASDGVEGGFSLGRFCCSKDT